MIPITPALVDYFGKNLPACIGMWLFGTPTLIFNSVASLNELFVTKNQFYSKHENERMFSQPLLGTNIVSMASDDPQYKTKRKVLSQAFFKSKIRSMMACVKSTALKVFKEVQDKNVDGKTEVDVVKLTSRLQNHIITNVMLGDGESFVKLPYQTAEGEKMVELADYTDDVLAAFFLRVQENILAIFYPPLLQYPITAIDKRLWANCNTLRTHLKKIINERK